MAKALAWCAALTFTLVCLGGALFWMHVVHAIGPAVVEIEQRDSQQSSSASSSNLGYPVQVVGYGETGKNVATIRATPDFVLPAFGGELLGADRGEWGGELMFRDRDGALSRLLGRNVRGIVQMPFGIVVFTGLAHLSSSTGGIYSVARRADGTMAATLIHKLDGAPSAIRWTTQGDLVFKVDILDPHSHSLFGGQHVRCLLLDKSGVLHRQLCAAILENQGPS